MGVLKMIEFIEIEKLTLLDNNPRRITKDQFEKLKKSLKEDPKFFELRPCLVNKVGDTLTVYAGNQRVRAAHKLKWTHVPCIIDEDLSKARMDSRILRDNLHYGEFDMDLTNALFDIDMLLDCGFTPEMLTGDYGDLKDTIINPSSKIAEDKSDENRNDNVKNKICPHCGLDI
jgi:ParB-like chromosome segregation protein Spo0J